MRWHESNEKIRFCEVDSFGVIWHCNCVMVPEVLKQKLREMPACCHG